MVFLSIFVTSPDTHSERRFDTSLTIAQIKDKLVPITGISPQYQVLRVTRTPETEQVLAVLDDDSKTLSECNVPEWSCLRVDNTDPNARPGEFTDLSAVDKFELTPEEYASRTGELPSRDLAMRDGRSGADSKIPCSRT